MLKFNRILLALGLLGGLCVIAFFTFLTLKGGASVAAADEELAYMYAPMAVCTVLTAISVGTAFTLALYLVLKSMRMNIIEKNSVKLLYVMGHACLLAAFFSIAAAVYAYSQLHQEVGLPGFYMLLFIGIFITGAMLLYFIAQVVADASDYRTDSELTV